MKKQNLLAEDFTGEPIVLDGYRPFFDGLMDIVGGAAICEGLGRNIHDYVLDYVKKTPLLVNGFNPHSYVRNYIGRDDSGWEAIVMSWQKGNRSAIHSHPQFASYTFADGEFLVEVFEPWEDSVKLIGEFRVEEPKCLYAIGADDGFDNHIHRITCLSQTGHSLHIYSDDALKGKKFDRAE